MTVSLPARGASSTVTLGTPGAVGAFDMNWEDEVQLCWENDTCLVWQTSQPLISLAARAAGSATSLPARS